MIIKINGIDYKLDGGIEFNNKIYVNEKGIIYTLCEKEGANLHIPYLDISNDEAGFKYLYAKKVSSAEALTVLLLEENK
jgi:hypothetical protein